MNRFIAPIATLVLLTVTACGDSANNSASNNASNITVYSARDIITMAPQQAHATAIAVTDGRILSVGSMDSVLAAIGDRQHVIDRSFADHVIVPGLIDQHVHPLLAAISLSMEVIAIEDWALPSGAAPAAMDRDDYLGRLTTAESEMANANEILFTWGFHHYFHGKLTRANLDEISAERPIVVWHRSAHEFILNTPAIEHFEINEEFVSGFSEAARAQSNLGDGHFWEQGWYPVLYKIMPTLASEERLQSGLEFVEEYFHAAGVTTIAEPGGLVSKPLQDAQNAVLGDAGTPFRSYFIVDGKTMATTQLDNLIPASKSVLDWGDGKTAFLPEQAKLFADGAIFSQAMQMLDGYEDGHEGEWMMDLDVFAAAFNAYWDAGYQLHIHQNGDAGLEMILDLLEAAQERNPRDDHRTVLVHFGFSSKEQVDRIAGLGAIVSANPYYLTALGDNYSQNGLGQLRADEMVRLGDVVRAGVSLSFHSDMPMAPGQPLFLMWSAVNRTTKSGRVAGPMQRISVEEALRAVTLNAAFSLQLEEEIGSLEEGKLANMTILEASPYEVDPQAIKDITIWGTMLEGVRYPLGTE
jgi:predicted amidohydrolase YtcJ